MLVLKFDVDPGGIQPELVLGLMIADGVYGQFGHKETVVTSIRDGKHLASGLHPKGKAFDLRTTAAGMGQFHAGEIAIALRRRLGNSYDVVVEKDHIHVEFDPSTPREKGKEENT